MAETDKISKEHEALLKPFAGEIKAIHESRPEGEWMVNIAHFQGYQYAEWDSRGAATGRLVLQPKRSHESVRVVENRIMPAVNKMVAVILQQIRTPQVRPPHQMSISERNKVEASNALLQELAQPWELDDTSAWEFFLRILVLTGTAFNWEYWNPRTGKEYKGAANEIYRSGKHDREVLLPFDVFPEMHVMSIHKMNHITVRRLSDVKEIKRHYKVTVPADRNLSQVGAADWQIRTLGTPGTNPTPSENAKYVYITLVRPTESQPDGREIHWTMVNDKPERVLYEGKNLNPDGELQVGMVQYCPIGPGWSPSFASQARQNNVAYNRMLSSMIQSEKNALNQVILVSNESKISEADLTERVRSKLSVIHYDADGMTPIPLAVPSPGNAGFQLLDQLDKGLSDMSYQHESMKGQVQGQIRSQPAVQEVRETDLLPLQPLIERTRTMICETGGWRLAMARRWFSEKRTASVMSDANQWKVYDFHKSKLSGSTQLYIPQEPNLPLSLGGKLDVLIKMVSIGTPPEQINAMSAELFHVDRISSVASLERDHREAQKEEIETLVTGEPLGVHSYDDDFLHMDELDRYRNRERQEFLSLAPMIQAQFQDHYEAHKEALYDDMMEQAEMAQLQAMAMGEGEEGGGEGGQQAGGQPGMQAAQVQNGAK